MCSQGVTRAEVRVLRIEAVLAPRRVVPTAERRLVLQGRYDERSIAEYLPSGSSLASRATRTRRRVRVAVHDTSLGAHEIRL